MANEALAPTRAQSAYPQFRSITPQHFSRPIDEAEAAVSAEAERHNRGYRLGAIRLQLDLVAAVLGSMDVPRELHRKTGMETLSFHVIERELYAHIEFLVSLAQDLDELANGLEGIANGLPAFLDLDQSESRAVRGMLLPTAQTISRLAALIQAE